MSCVDDLNGEANTPVDATSQGRSGSPINVRDAGTIALPVGDTVKRIVRLVAHVFRVPIVVVALGDAEDVMVPWHDGGSVTDLSDLRVLARHVLTNGDARAAGARDAAPSRLPGTPFACFVAEPLRDTTGAMVGLLGIADQRTRRFATRARVILREFADQIEDVLARMPSSETTNTRDDILTVTDQPRDVFEVLSQKTQFESMGNVTRQGVLILSPELTVVWVNRRFCAMWNVTEEEMLGFGLEGGLRKIAGQLQITTELTDMLQDFASLTGRSTRTLRFRDGRVFEYYGMPVKSPEGTKYGMVVFFQDVTERAWAEEDALFQTTLLNAQSEASRDGIVTLSRDGRALGQNRRFLEIWGLSDAETVPTTLEEGLRYAMGKTADPNALGRVFAHLNEHPEDDEQTEIPLIDGRILDFDTRPLRGRDGTIYGRVVFLRDVTGQRRDAAEILYQKTLLQAQADATREGIVVIRPDGAVTSVNRRFCEMWGLARDEIADIHVEAVFPRLAEQFAQGDVALSDLRRFLHGADVPRSTLRLRDGRRFEYYGTVVRDSGGRDYGRAIFFLDVTDRERAREAFERLSHRNELILNSAGEGILDLDAAGRVRFVNPSATRLTGFATADLLGQEPYDLLDPAAAADQPASPAEHPIACVLRAGQPRFASGEMFRRKDGTSFPVEYVAAPIVEGDAVVGAVVTFRDVSERYRIEKLKNEFISVVSHELRTPLTSIRGSLGLLASGLIGPLSAQAQHMLDIAVKNTDRLVALINDILDVERIDSGKALMQKQDCDAADLMVQAVETVQAMADKAGVSISMTPFNVRLFADPNRIIQVFTNLLSNAIKFSPAGGKICMDAAQRGDQIQFRVQDEGRGIPPDKIESIFERFQQVDASDSREKGGTGLGLAICRGIAHQHNGRIWAESGPEHGTGSTFFFTIPALAGETSASPAVESDGPTVLICDDDPSIRSVVNAMLVQRGYRVVAVGDGEAAVREAITLHPGAILLDLLMPGMNGWETLAALRRHEETQTIPVIICSAIPPDDDLPPRSTIVDWVTKPFEEALLFQALHRALHQSAVTPRVLIVEDDVDLAQVLVAMFQRSGVETFHARSGREAIHLSQEVAPDLIVLDLILPEGDGFAVVDWLGQHDRLRGVCLVVYSAKDVSNADRQRLHLGETQYFTKGQISPAAFVDRVVAVLTRVVPRRPAAAAERGTEGVDG